MTAPLSRRAMLARSAGAAAGLVLAFRLPASLARAAATKTAAPASFVPNAFLRIAPDGLVTVVVHKVEMGQGAYTSIPMLVAEELEAAWSSIRVESAPVGSAYVMKGDFGQQVTGGSTSTHQSWEPLREAGAAAREMLVSAAARRWKVDRSACRAEPGVGAIVGPDGARATYGELATDAAREKRPGKVTLKDPKDFRVIGTTPPRLDVPAKTEGKATYGIDVVRPGMLIAVVARPPVFGATLARFDAKKALAVPGVKNVFAIEQGVAVVADGYWNARKGREALDVTWNEGARAANSDARIRARFEKTAARKASTVRKEGNAAKALAAAATKIDAVYTLPFLAHATMEPQNCTAEVKDGQVQVWGPIQNQSAARRAAAKFGDVPKESVRIHTTLLGGGFGRRLEWDYVEEAVQIAKIAAVPVKVLWSREDDMRHGFYRPASHHTLSGSLDASGELTGWFHRLVCPSILGRILPIAAKIITDPTSTDGARQLAYGIPNIRVECARQEQGVPVGPWRSVGHSHNGFVTESFIDELAHAAKKDPVEFRRTLLTRAKKKRHLGVLDLVAGKAGWGTPLPAGRARGIAVHDSFGSYVAEVAEVSVDEDGIVKVHRVVCAVDCGRVVNPSIVEAQMQSAIVFALSSLKGAITILKGRVVESNFHDYKMLRMSEMPAIEVHLVTSTAKKLGGIGEPGVPPLAPAVTNAIFALTGKRLRALPIDPASLRTRAPAPVADPAAPAVEQEW